MNKYSKKLVVEFDKYKNKNMHDKTIVLLIALLIVEILAFASIAALLFYILKIIF